MSEEQQQTEVDAAEQPQEGAEQRTFDAEYVEKLRKESAKYRTEAKANAEAAKRLAEIEEASKSEAEKQAERLAAAEQEAAAARSEAVRLRVAAKYGIGDEDADLFLTGTDEDTLTAQAQRLAERGTKHGNTIPNIGNNPQPPADEGRNFLRQLTGRA